MKTEIMYRILFGVILVLFFVIGVYIGVEISSKEEQSSIIAATNKEVKIDVTPYEEKNENKEESNETSEEDVVLDVSVKYTDVYPDCGHTIETEEEYWDTTVSIMKAEIEDKDLGYRLIGEEQGVLIYQKVHNGKCLNHYKVILENNTVKIYRINFAGEYEFYQDTEITSKTIREGIKEQLEKGIEVDELEELLLIIEDIES